MYKFAHINVKEALRNRAEKRALERAVAARLTGLIVAALRWLRCMNGYKIALDGLQTRRLAV